jgi:membrane protein implicated in regulation of membrane protease activity
MAETLYRLAYDVTIDDAVEIALRFALRTRTLGAQIRAYVIITGIIGGAAFVAVWLYYAAARTPAVIATALAAGAVFGVVFALLFRRFLSKEMRKQHRKLLLEQFGGTTVIPSELELRDDALWVRQAGIELTFPWRLCTSIVDNADDVEVNFSAGISVVRNRYFPSMAERQQFLDTARRLAPFSLIPNR